MFGIDSRARTVDPPARMEEDDVPIEYRLVRDGTVVEFEVVDSKIEPTVGDEDWHVRMELRVDDELIECCGFGLIFVLGMLSFHDGRPRGDSGKFFVDDDEWNVADMLARIRFERGELRFYADYVRGRCMKTRIDVSSDGRIVLETVNRGQAATW